MKQEDLYFVEWEQDTFGSGYGSGEMAIFQSIKTFFSLIENNRIYNHEILEKGLGETITWLLINTLDKGHVLEWGTSARNGWLTSSGEFLKKYMDNKTVEELYEIVMSDNLDTCHCGGSIKGNGHETCGKNYFIYEKIADGMKYSK